MQPLAYFLTWTTYGTWLHGDPRGSVDDAHSTYSTPYVSPNRSRIEFVSTAMREAPLVLSEADRNVVNEAIRRSCEIRRWAVLALNVRSNHVHTVVAASDASPEHAAAILKSWATRALKASGSHPGRSKFWTNQSSTRWLFDEQAVANASTYTMNQ